MKISKFISYAKAYIGIKHEHKAFGLPPQIQISPTNRCNLRCIHCYFYSKNVEFPAYPPLRLARIKGDILPDPQSLKNYQTQEADVNKLKSLIDDLNRMGVTTYQFSGKGEPFVYKHFMDIAGRIKKGRNRIYANTNGTLLGHDTIDELINMGFDELRITIMAASKETYVETHPGTSPAMFEKIQDSLHYIADQKKALNCKYPKITLVFIVISQNCEEIVEFSRLAASANVDQVWYRSLNTVEDSGLTHLMINNTQADFVKKQLPLAASFLRQKGIKHNIDAFFKAFHKNLNTFDIYNTIPCCYGWLSIYIEPDGTVYPCCGCHESFGNIFESKFNEIWNGTKYQSFRNDALNISSNNNLRGCECNACVHYLANLRVFKAIHPIKNYFLDRKLEP